jgi:hypothetical protein
LASDPETSWIALLMGSTIPKPPDSTADREASGPDRPDTDTEADRPPRSDEPSA